MSKENPGLNGYCCTKCSEQGLITKTRALYVRSMSGFTYSGYVLCKRHHVQRGISIKKAIAQVK